MRLKQEADAHQQINITWRNFCVFISFGYKTKKEKFLFYLFCGMKNSLLTGRTLQQSQAQGCIDSMDTNVGISIGSIPSMTGPRVVINWFCFIYFFRNYINEKLYNLYKCKNDLVVRAERHVNTSHLTSYRSFTVNWTPVFNTSGLCGWVGMQGCLSTTRELHTDQNPG